MDVQPLVNEIKRAQTELASKSEGAEVNRDKVGGREIYLDVVRKETRLKVTLLLVGMEPAAIIALRDELAGALGYVDEDGVIEDNVESATLTFYINPTP